MCDLNPAPQIERNFSEAAQTQDEKLELLEPN